VAHRVPLMTPDAVAVRWSHQQPFLTVGLTRVRVAVLASDPLAVSPGPETIVVPDDAALRAVLRSSLVDGHLAPLLERLRARVHVGRRTLWGSVASGVAHGLSRAADALPGATLDIAHDLLSLLDVEDLVEISPAATGAGLDVQRKTCCLAFTLPEPKICAGCCIRTL
jgi:ferric iron reductase protein FhuF